MKKYLAIIIVGTGIACANGAFAQGVPTFDYATVMQLMQQYEQLKQQYAAVTGNYGRGSTGLEDAMRSASVVPGSWQDVVNQQNAGVYGSKQAYYEQQIQTMPNNQFQDPRGQSATNYTMSTNSVRAAFAGGDSLYSEVQTHINNIGRLSAQIDSTTNIKDAQDLQNRLSTETALLQSAQAKLAALNTNLQANQVNEMNQATALNEKFYR